MERRYISAVKPLGQYILQVDFVSGSRLLLDMKPYLGSYRTPKNNDCNHYYMHTCHHKHIRLSLCELKQYYYLPHIYTIYTHSNSIHEYKLCILCQYWLLRRIVKVWLLKN